MLELSTSTGRLTSCQNPINAPEGRNRLKRALSFVGLIVYRFFIPWQYSPAAALQDIEHNSHVYLSPRDGRRYKRSKFTKQQHTWVDP